MGRQKLGETDFASDCTRVSNTSFFFLFFSFPTTTVDRKWTPKSIPYQLYKPMRRTNLLKKLKNPLVTRRV